MCGDGSSSHLRPMDSWLACFLQLLKIANVFFVFVFLVSSRLMVLRLDPSILPPTPHCLGAREANILGEAAAEAPNHTCSCSSLSSPSPPLCFYRTVQAHKQFVNLPLSLSLPTPALIHDFIFSFESSLSFCVLQPISSLNLLTLPEILLPIKQPDFLRTTQSVSLRFKQQSHIHSFQLNKQILIFQQRQKQPVSLQWYIS